MNKEYKNISNKLEDYESIFDTEPNLSLKKMIDLYPFAAELFNHEVCDAIHIWLYNYADNDIKIYLAEKISIKDKFENIYQVLLKK